MEWMKYFLPCSAPATSPLPLFGVIDNWTPSMKVKKFENFGDKISSTGCKWSSLNVPSTENPVSHPVLSESLFPFSVPLTGVIDNWTPSMKVKKFEIFWDKISSTGCKWSSLNAPSTETPVSHPILCESLFPFSVPLTGLIDNWTPV